MDYLYYHENHIEKPFLPQEDFGLHNVEKGLFIVADGVTLDPESEKTYSYPSDAFEVAKILTETTVNTLLTKDQVVSSDLHKALMKGNEKVKMYVENTMRWKNRESNGYSIGSAVAAVMCIKDKLLNYAMVEDCNITLLRGGKLETLNKDTRFENAREYLKTFPDGYDWGNQEHRARKRRDIVNNDDIEKGLGIFDGRPGVEKYIVEGSETLVSGDIVFIYSDGFVNAINDADFTSLFRKDLPSQLEVHAFMRSKNYTDEKTFYAVLVK